MGSPRLVWVTVFLLCLAAAPCLCVKETKFYDVLGVSPDADDRTLKKAYKKQALKWHPDRHTADKKKAEERFKDIAHAYETLSDPEKRQLYDQFGEAGLKQGGPGGPGGPGGASFQFHGDPFEMFNMFFGGGGGGGGRQQFQFGGGGFPGGAGGGFKFQGGGGGGFPGGFGGGGGPHMGGGGQRGGGGAGLYDGDSNVLSLDGSSFPSSSNGWVWLVEFYAPWCGHCQQLAPKWKKVAASLKGVVMVAAVNCEEHKGICSQRGVSGYPTIQALPPSGSNWVDYQGDRSAASLSNWATSLIGNAAVNIKKEADLDTFLSKCGGASSSSRGGASKKDAGASWGLCLLLQSDKSSMPMLWKALSVAFKGKVAFGFIGSSAQPAVAAKLGAAGQESKVVSVCNGDLRTAEPFKGKLKSEPLQRHINTYAAGKKCVGQVVLDSNTDLTKMKVAQLKALISAKGVDCSACVEKSDYVAALRGWLEKQQGSSGASKQEL